MSKIYYIYHIPHYVWDGLYKGKIGKIGVTSLKVKDRFWHYKNQNLSDWEVLEEHICKFTVSDREIELQKQYGYPVDKILSWKTIKNGLSEKSINARKQSGKSIGKWSKESGHLDKIRKIAGETTGRIHANSGHMDKMRELSLIASKKTLLQYNKDGNFIKEWFSASVACRELNLNNGNISAVCNGKRKSSGGFIWKYKDETIKK